ncbi:hypothetical protein KDK_33960 [Dictyobacter kobayashii]|uniref:Uncharacterized protein n=1 Tax=Dictyobacter kobayashii TaxID=2014872 RepID=A0A402AKD9_9CHLR|nr:hypothetical protein KDK_33960 [Dictyobacter kobayashii]
MALKKVLLEGVKMVTGTIFTPSNKTARARMRTSAKAQNKNSEAIPLYMGWPHYFLICSGELVSRIFFHDKVNKQDTELKQN